MKKVKVIALGPISHDGVDFGPGEKVEMTDKQADQAVGSRVAVPDSAEGRAFVKELLATPTPEIGTDPEAAPAVQLAAPKT